MVYKQRVLVGWLYPNNDLLAYLATHYVIILLFIVRQIFKEFTKEQMIYESACFPLQ